ncbi:MAG: glycine cleavage system aminomethyltransferase GcvT, partial [Endomicrobium sp.]|nr:glycine cleavage system aminomethyltransferase GcvT [Endomicrobium sp.]
MKRTYLYDEHLKLGARFTEFSGWEMPLLYSSIINEHNAVRNAVGVFDASHMGVFTVSGSSSEEFLNRVCLGNISGLPEKKARYSMILNENAGIKDDIIVYNLGFEYMVVVNAGNLKKDWQWLNLHKTGKVSLENVSEKLCLFALQGPKAVEIMQSVSETDVSSIKYFTISGLKLKNIDAEFAMAARTGYTGEDGFEIFISNADGAKFWNELMKLSVTPCGLGCRD